MGRLEVINIMLRNPKEFKLYGDLGHMYEQAQKLANKKHVRVIAQKYGRTTN